jgi:hypothetical protein
MSEKVFIAAMTLGLVAVLAAVLMVAAVVVTLFDGVCR